MLRTPDQLREREKAGKLTLDDIVAYLVFERLRAVLHDRPTIPRDILDLIGRKIAGRTQWSREKNEARRNKAAQVTVRYQQEANAIWRRKPRLSSADVARLIAHKLGGRADTIRRKIQRPK